MICCIGAFDGYHRGHQRLFDKARDMAREVGDSWGIVTFFPNPKRVLCGDDGLRMLFTEGEKRVIERRLGLPDPCRVDFNRQVMEMEPEFFLDFLRDRFDVTGVVVGENFRFGKARSGNREFLLGECARRGWHVCVVPSMALEDGTVVSSSRIREFVLEGRMEKAREFLGYPWFLASKVVQGDRRGRTLGFPTANLSVPGDKILPPHGVYAALARVWGKEFACALSVGLNPTFDAPNGVRVEAHILDFEGDIYGQDMEVDFWEYLRPMVKFGSKDELVAQMKVDRDMVASRFELRD